jgi:hypothetical protein
MQRITLPIALALSLVTVAAGAAVAIQDAEGRYQAMLAAAKASAPNADWGQLRLAFADRPGFKVFSQSAARRQMLQAANAGNCAEALRSARAVIAEAYVDADAHLVAAYCEDAAGSPVAAKLDRDIGAGLLQSIKTGDGLSPATAFTVIDVDEEYALTRALGLTVASQSLVQQGGHSYDVLQAADDKGQRATYYFLVDRVLAAEAATAAAGKPAP